MRELTGHKVNGLNEALTIEVLEEPGQDGACRVYDVHAVGEHSQFLLQQIVFQSGPTGEAGINGISDEALLAIVEDRLAGFELGPFACLENSTALGHVRMAMKMLHEEKRTRVIARPGTPRTQTRSRILET